MKSNKDIKHPREKISLPTLHSIKRDGLDRGFLISKCGNDYIVEKEEKDRVLLAGCFRLERLKYLHFHDQLFVDQDG